MLVNSLNPDKHSPDITINTEFVEVKIFESLDEFLIGLPYAFFNAERPILLIFKHNKDFQSETLESISQQSIEEYLFIAYEFEGNIVFILVNPNVIKYYEDINTLVLETLTAYGLGEDEMHNVKSLGGGHVTLKIGDKGAELSFLEEYPHGVGLDFQTITDYWPSSMQVNNLSSFKLLADF